MLHQSDTATSSSSLFQVPDLVRTNLLRKISSEGGFSYVTSIATAVISDDLRAAEAAREMAWEQLHSGPWNEVGPVWRDAYAMACLYVAGIRAKSGDLDETMKILDLGVIMGGGMLRKELDDAIDWVRKAKNENFDEGDISFGCVDKLDLQKVLQILPKRSLSCNTVEKKSSMSLETFISDYFLRSLPVIITDCIEDWPARTKWKDIEYLKKIAGNRTVPVEVGKNYLASDWKQELVTFSQFLERTKSIESSSNLTYLAQHPLFDQIQELQNDIMIPDYCYAGGGQLESLNAWFGPVGTVTPLHHDPHHNMFAQVVGRKYIRLYPATVSEDLYPHTESMLSNSSQVDLDDYKADEFPKAENLEFVDCVLEEGEMLYIPPKWWHYVRSLSLSFSVSFWWSAAGFPPVVN